MHPPIDKGDKGLTFAGIILEDLLELNHDACH